MRTGALLCAILFSTIHSVIGSPTVAAATSYPDPLPLEGPFFFVHDPSMLQRQSDGRYFLFTTHDKAGILTAEEIQGPWTEIGSILPNNSTIQLPGRDDIWAPDVSFYDGRYYAYYSVSTFGSQNSAIGLATSATMDAGTWSDHGLVINSTAGDEYNCIDPSLHIGADGIPRLTFGSFWDNIFQVELGSNLQTVVSQPEQLSYNATDPHPEEGSFIWQHGQYYYLFISSGTCCGFDPQNLPSPGGQVFVGRSSSPSGPFVDKSGVDMRESGGALVLASHGNVYAPGGQVVFNDNKLGRDVFAYHYVPVNSPSPYNDSYASLGLNGIDWSSGWPVLTSL
ncbi:glycoside hydrolase family 43 protein [Heliocybe sulcata]|uniref:Arabinan endo-1,5-alpha-L-arabinosidase n=1 Tax=Heliocybe sulcata TaxID=5364 RepID=A0A5C3NAY8_9AGAM|nr:glycoside hydrolase family 43 protein [Heliocybe sulcata]